MIARHKKPRHDLIDVLHLKSCGVAEKSLRGCKRRAIMEVATPRLVRNLTTCFVTSRNSTFISKGVITEQWCKLTFPTVYKMNRLTIWNRADCDCPERIDGVKVFVDEALLGKIKYVVGKYQYSFIVPQGEGQVIRLCCSAVSLAIAELEVYVLTGTLIFYINYVYIRFRFSRSMMFWEAMFGGGGRVLLRDGGRSKFRAQSKLEIMESTDYGIFGEGSQISTYQKRESTVFFSILVVNEINSDISENSAGW